MSAFQTLFGRIKQFVVTYPAVLSGYVIYAYLFIAIVRFMLMARYATVSFGDAVEIFLPLPFMWLLAVSLVKVIEIRTRLHDSERKRMQDAKELDMKRMQLQTLREVVRGVQHQINNPLAIALLTADKLKAHAADMGMVIECANEVSRASVRIAEAIVGFSRMEEYNTETAGAYVGSIATPDDSHLCVN